MMQEARFRQMLTLLDDPDESVGRFAMGELLNDAGGSLLPILAEIQESPNPVLRRRAHQLQSALTLRARRHRFFQLINNPDLDLAEGLIQLHLQYYDNDGEGMIRRKYENFLADAEKSGIKSTADLAGFLRKSKIAYTPESTLQPERYCIGTVLDNNCGTGTLLAALGFLLGKKAGIRLQIVRIMGDFALFDPARREVLTPRDNWRLGNDIPASATLQEWTAPTLVKFAAAMLFANSVNTDSFRYVHTFAQALAGLRDDEVPDFLPYPYNGREAP